MKLKTFQKEFKFAISILTHVNRIIPFFSLYNCISRILGITKVQLFLIKGTVKSNNCSTTILFIGKGKSACARANYFAYTVFSQIERLVYIGEFLYRQVNSSDFKNAEIIVVDANIESTKKLLEQDFLLLPEVCFELDLTRSISDLIKRSSGRRKRSIKKIRSLNYSYVICRNNEKKFDFYYWKMYLPYIRSRFAIGAQPTSYLRSKAFYRKNGGVIFVLKGKRPIAGMLFRVRGKTLDVLNLGVYGGEQKYLKDCACEAALFFLIKWSKIKGLKSLNYGVTVPFLTNGIFQYKKEWGMFVEEVTDQLFCALKIVAFNENSLSFLLHNPFIFLGKNAMKEVVFVDHRLSKAELQKLFSIHLFPKVDSLIVIGYYDKKTEEKNVINFSSNSQNIPIVLGKALSRICLSFLKRGFDVDVFRERSQNLTLGLGLNSNSQIQNLDKIRKPILENKQVRRLP
jgi:hypothetical protein